MLLLVKASVQIRSICYLSMFNLMIIKLKFLITLFICNQTRADWLVYAVLSCLPWSGKELSEKKEVELDRLLSSIEGYLEYVFVLSFVLISFACLKKTV